MKWLSADWVSAIGTIGAVVLALFIVLWDKYQGRARLKVRFRPGPPDWGSALTQRQPEEGSPESLFVVRIVVENRGPAAARTVEAVIHDVEKLKEATWVREARFLSSALRWTHGGERCMQLLLPRTAKHIDLGEIRRTSFADNDAIFIFTITPQPNSAYNIAQPGDYRFCITVAAENARPTIANFCLKLTGAWDPDDQAMSSKGLTLTQL